MNFLTKMPAVFLMIKMMSVNKRFVMLSSIVYLTLLIVSAYSLGYWSLILFILSFPIFLLIVSISTALKFKRQMMQNPLEAMMNIMPDDLNNMMKMVNNGNMQVNGKNKKDKIINNAKSEDIIDVIEKDVRQK